MAEYKGMQGHWVTTKEGRHLFISDEEMKPGGKTFKTLDEFISWAKSADTEDEVDRQEREIKEREEATKKLTAEMRDEDYIEGGNDYPELAAEEVVDGLIEEWQDFSDSGGDGIPGDVYAHDDLSESGKFSDKEIEQIFGKDMDYDLACKFLAWYAIRDMAKPYTKAKVFKELNSWLSDSKSLNDKAMNEIMKYIK